MPKYNLADIKKGPKKNLLEKEVTNGQKEARAEKAMSDKKSLGRPKKDRTNLLSRKVTVNFTEEEEKTLLELSKRYLDAPLPKLIRSLLKEKNII